MREIKIAPCVHFTVYSILHLSLKKVSFPVECLFRHRQLVETQHAIAQLAVLSIVASFSLLEGHLRKNYFQLKAQSGCLLAGKRVGDFPQHQSC